MYHQVYYYIQYLIYWIMLFQLKLLLIAINMA